MKRTNIRWIAFVLTIMFTACILAACDRNNVPAGVYFPEAKELIPAIDTFSGTVLEDYKYQFSPVESAVLKIGDEETEISPDDPRLVRLLNMFAYASSNFLSPWRQSYVLEDEINGYLSSDAPMLVVYFMNDKESDHMEKRTPKMVICGDTYLLFEKTGEMLAIRYWPFQDVFYDHYGLYGVPAEIKTYIIFPSWGGESWIDFLVYAGFEID